MAHRGTFRGRGITQSQRRKKTWLPIQGPATTDGILFGDQTLNIQFIAPTGPLLNSPQDQLVGFFSFPDELPEESTILRIRGSLEVVKNATGVGFVDNFAFGIGVMERTAAEQGAVPNPATPQGAAWDGWMFYRSSQLPTVEAQASIVDVKSMRKMQGGNALIIVAGSQRSTESPLASAAAPAIDASFNGRFLILLP